MFSICVYNSILYWRASHSVIIHTFNIFYTIFRAISNIQPTIVLIFKSGITLQPINICHVLWNFLPHTDWQLTAYVRVHCTGRRVYAWVCHFQQSPTLHALSIFRCLHAVSITRRFQSWSLTRCFRYTQIPYPHKRLYPPFPLHAHSVYPLYDVAVPPLCLSDCLSVTHATCVIRLN